MRYISTRGKAHPVDFSGAVLQGLARDGGLFLPEVIPNLTPRLRELSTLSYRDLALEVFYPFAAGEISKAEWKALIDQSYRGFRAPEVTPLAQKAGQYILELFHGPTFAFKDVALQVLGNLFELLLERKGQSLNILGATSGDTGSAAIYGVRGKKGIEIFMLHPQGRVSAVQERQMTTVRDKNVHNIAVEGTFDDCQAIVKACFNDLEFRDTYHLGAVNSINWARVLAQIVYYFYAAFRFWEIEPGSPLVFSVPTGNFGDVFAGYMAKRMGLPIEKLVVATNENDILSRCVQKGDYSPQTLHPSYSPSMDIQLASNFERYLFELEGRDGEKTGAKMKELETTGKLRFAGKELSQIQRDFAAFQVDDLRTLDCIRNAFQQGYLLDPHSAVGVEAAKSLGYTKAICLATAHPAKFDEAVKKAIGQAPKPPLEISELLGLPTRCVEAKARVEDIQQIIRSTLGEKQA